MARVNVDILGISKLKGTGMGEFNSDNHYIYYCGQESLRRNRVAIMVNMAYSLQLFSFFLEIHLGFRYKESAPPCKHYPWGAQPGKQSKD